MKDGADVLNGPIGQNMFDLFKHRILVNNNNIAVIELLKLKNKDTALSVLKILQDNLYITYDIKLGLATVVITPRGDSKLRDSKAW